MRDGRLVDPLMNSQNAMPALRSAALIVLGLLVLGGMGMEVRAQSEVIEPTGQWVTDRGEFLSASEERALTRQLRTYADTTSTQIVVVTLPSLGGADPAQYATELGQSWGVGTEQHDNGIVILVSREDRRAFIATGMGMEGAVPDIIAGRIVRNILVPAFRDGQFYGGLSGTVDAIAAAARGEYEAVAGSEDAGEGGGGMDLATLFVLLIIAAFFIKGIRGGGGGSSRGKKVRRDSETGSFILWGGALGGFGRSGGGAGGGGMGGGMGGFSGGGGGFGGGGAGGGW